MKKNERGKREGNILISKTVTHPMESFKKSQSLGSTPSDSDLIDLGVA